MRLSRLPPSTLLYLLVAIAPVQASVKLDFSTYPEESQPCLEDAAGISGCSGDTVTETNECLCSNTNGFVTNTAACIGTHGDTILTQVWAYLQKSCTATKTPLSVSEAEFFESVETVEVTSTITTTSAGSLQTYVTTTTSTKAAVAETTSADSDDESSTKNDEVLMSARIGAITASVAGILAIVCVICLIVLLQRRNKDKVLLREAQEAARHGDGYRGPDKPLLHPGEVTPGLLTPGMLTPGLSTPGLPPPGPSSPALMSPAVPGHEQVIGASIVPPTPSYAGPMTPHDFRSMPRDPSNVQRSFELHDDNVTGHPPHWPSPVSQQGTGTIGSWCPSPLTAGPAGPSSNVLGMYNNGGTGTIGASSPIGASTLSRQIAGPTASHSSWAHERRPQSELYELPGIEVRKPAEADSRPVGSSRAPEPERAPVPERMSMVIGSPPPEYSAGGWNDPITDKPPTNWI